LPLDGAIGVSMHNWYQFELDTTISNLLACLHYPR